MTANNPEEKVDESFDVLKQINPWQVAKSWGRRPTIYQSFEKQQRTPLRYSAQHLFHSKPSNL